MKCHPDGKKPALDVAHFQSRVAAAVALSRSAVLDTTRTTHRVVAGELRTPKELALEFCPNYIKIAWSRHEQKYPHPAGSPEALTLPKNSAKKPPVLLTRLRCKQWSCEYCAAKNQAIWRAFLHERLPTVSDEWWLMTLTAHSKKRSQAASYANLQKGIDVLLKRSRRLFGSIQYVRVYEKHPTSQALHAHLIISDLSPFVVLGCWKNLQPGYLAVLTRPWWVGIWSLSTWLKKSCQAVGLGYQDDVQKLEGFQAVGYATKYLTKAAQEIEIKGIHHVQTSKGIGSPGFDSLYRWHVADFATARDFNAGDAVHDVQTGKLIDADYWADNDIYPPLSELAGRIAKADS